MIYRLRLQTLTCSVLVLCVWCAVVSASAATFLVTNVGDSGAGSLRQAIDSANALPGPDVIQFSIPGAGTHIIVPTVDLPPIDQVTIDGQSQPGYSDKPLIVISGTHFGTSVGLQLSDNCSVRGLAINSFSSIGILIYGSSNIISGCFMGTDAAGVIAQPNHIGILVEGLGYNLIGGITARERNVISGNSDLGICLLYSPANTVQGNFIGTDLTGSAALPNSNDGISIDHSSDSNIGGTAAGEGNLISGNGASGIRIFPSPAIGNIIQGNLIGVDRTGTVALGNRSAGITIFDAPENTIGGSDRASRNVISGNLGDGIAIQNQNATDNVIEGNFIGLNVTGGAAVPNGLSGISVANASGNTIGGISSAAANIISGNRNYGVNLGGSANVLQGNFIGTDPSGIISIPNALASPLGAGVLVTGSSQTIGGDSLESRNIISGNYSIGIALQGAVGCVLQANWIGLDSNGNALGNGSDGIVLRSGAQHNTIGGANADERNLCAGNRRHGILLQGTSTSDNVIAGNLVGLSSDGLPRGNTGAGISIVESASGNLIGGSNAGEGNVIGNNGATGVQIVGCSLNVLQGNWIGLSAPGPCPNHGPGVLISGGAANDQIGGTAPGEANQIAYNAGGGVLVRDGYTMGITISANSIFDNGGLAINLQAPGEKDGTPTPNDPMDNDNGPNRLQNFPVITNVTYTSGLTIVSGSLRSKPNSDFQVEIFRNDPYSNFILGQGQFYVGALDVSTDASGFAGFQFAAPGNFSNQLFTATATDTVTGDTSEFSGAIPISKGVLRITDVRPAGSNVQISFTTMPELSYAVEWAADLPAVQWNAVPVGGSSNVAGTGNVVTVSDPGAASMAARFYRIRQL